MPRVTVSEGADIEEGGTAVFTIRANPAPASTLTVNITVDETGGFYGPNYVRDSLEGERTVRIGAGRSEVAYRVRTQDNAKQEDDEAVVVSVREGNGYTVPASRQDRHAYVSVRDNDGPPPGVTIDRTALALTEGGATGSYSVRLDTAPHFTVTVTPASGDRGAVAVSGPLTFDFRNWAKPQTVTVTALNDADAYDESVTLTHAVNGYGTVTGAAAVTVTVEDDDPFVLPTLSIADAQATEGDPVVFQVTLSKPSREEVSVDYETNRRLSLDFTPTSGTLRFPPGETERRISVRTRQDSHDEDPETFRMLLSNAAGATIADGEATGTIVNNDPMPSAWLARFGRTVAAQALEGIAGRLEAPRAPGMQGALAGQAIGFDPRQPGEAVSERDEATATAGLARMDGADDDRFAAGSPGSGTVGSGGAGVAQGTAMTAHELLLGSSFSLTGGKDSLGGSVAFWGRAAQGSFDGRDRGDGSAIGLDGEVTTGMLGADYARGNWLVGLALTQSEGEGGYRDTNPAPPPPVGSVPSSMDGEVESSLTAAIPYAALQASERLKLWGALGHGSGEVTLTPKPGSEAGAGEGGAMSAGTGWTMAAAGLRSDLLTPSPEGSPALALVSDALWARTTSEKTRELAASDSEVTRLRLGLEGSWHLALDGGGSLTPKLELGARHDGGDAETGFGAELGGGIAWVDPGIGLSLDLSGRTLIAHEDGDLKDRGVSASLAFDPDPASERGPSFSLRQDFGGRANGGIDALFANDPQEDRTGGEPTSRWSAEAAYGLPAFGGRFTATPHVGLGLSTDTRDLSVGWRWTTAANASDLSFGVTVSRRESDGAEPEHAAGLEIRARW